MPDPNLMAPGFFGKLPSCGDFVSRRLPCAFIAPWDCWVTRHLVPRLRSDSPPLCFHRPGFPAFAGVVIASCDSAGRRFPLTLAARSVSSSHSEGDRSFDVCRRLQSDAVAPLRRLAALGRSAVADRLSPDALAARLETAAAPSDAFPACFLIWTDPARARMTDPDHPGPVLDALLGAPAESS